LVGGDALESGSVLKYGRELFGVLFFFFVGKCQPRKERDVADFIDVDWHGRRIIADARSGSQPAI
jgi:hypothetical protein